MERSSEVESLVRVREGDQEAFAELVRCHGDYLFGVARALVRDEHEAQDVVQETFAAVLTSRFHGQASVRTWLVAITVKQAAMVRRRCRPWLRLWRPEESDPPNPSDPPQSPARPSHQDTTDARLDLATLLATLSAEHREVIVLRELQAMSYEEMARTLGVPRGTIESRLHRARRQLRQAAGADHDL